MHQSTHELRFCPRCKQHKPATLEYFGSNRGRKDGFAIYCRTCVTEYNREYRERNAEKLKAQKREYHQSLKQDPERWEEQLRKSRQWKRAHSEHMLPANRAYRRRKRAYRNAYNRRWRAQNPDMARQGTIRYTERKNALPSGFSDDDWNRALAYWEYRCAYCGDGGPLETDHVVPVSDTSSDNPGDVPWNIVPSCRSCNATKHNKALGEFLRSIYPEHKAREVERRINVFFWRVKVLVQK